LGGLWLEANPKEIVRDPISKITRAKWTGGVAQVVEHLLCKASSSDFKPQSYKKIKNTECWPGMVAHTCNPSY
jgi:hypothetical protein